MTLTVDTFTTNFRVQLDLALGSKASKSEEGVREKTTVMKILDGVLREYKQVGASNLASILSVFKQSIEAAKAKNTEDTDEVPSKAKRSYQSEAKQMAKSATLTISTRTADAAKQAFANTRVK